MSVWSSYGRGRYVADEDDVVLLPRAYPQDGSAVGVVYCHGAGGSALDVSDPVGRAGEWAVLRGIAERHPVVVADLGGQFTFGNPTTVQRIDAARRYLQERWGARAGRIVLVGTSMGGVGALNYAAAHRDRVAAVVGLVPVCDLQELYANDEYTPYIAHAWNLKVGQPLPTAANPVNKALHLLGLPLQLWYARDDDVVPTATIDLLLSLVGLSGESHDVGRLGHTEEAIGAASVPDILRFLDRHAA